MSRTPKVMLDVKEGNNLMFLPLDQLFGRSGLGSNSAGGLPSSNSDNKSLIDEFKRNVNRSRERETRQ
jgi:hypothetical protein